MRTDEQAILQPPLRPDSLEFQHPATRLVLRDNAVDNVGGEVRAIGCRRVMLVCGPNTARTELFARARASLGDLCVHVLDGVVEHSSTRLVDESAGIARREAIDGLVAVGGGSSSDTAKAIAIVLAEGGRIEDHASSFTPPDKFVARNLKNPKLPIVTVPTTASAAEATFGLGVTNEHGEKLLFSDFKLASRVIVLDPAANTAVPASLLATTGMNGLAHCLEGLYSRTRNPISESLALKGIELFAAGLPAMVREPKDAAHRAIVLLAAHLAGATITNSRVGIHHGICHCLGGMGRLPHGVSNSIILPHALAYNLPVAQPQLALAARAFGVDAAGMSEAEAAQSAIDAVRRLQAQTGVPTRLRDVGLSRELFPAIADHVLADRSLYFNPRQTSSAEPVLEILEAAW